MDALRKADLPVCKRTLLGRKKTPQRCFRFRAISLVSSSGRLRLSMTLLYTHASFLSRLLKTMARAKGFPFSACRVSTLAPRVPRLHTLWSKGFHPSIQNLRCSTEIETLGALPYSRRNILGDHTCALHTPEICFRGSPLFSSRKLPETHTRTTCSFLQTQHAVRCTLKVEHDGSTHTVAPPHSSKE